MSRIDLPIRAATETALAHGATVDRCEILQDGSTLVLRLSEDLVARVVTDLEGPRKGGDWFARENAVALHLTQSGAPVIPLYKGIPPGPHEHLGYTLNFWQFVTAIDAEPDAMEIGKRLRQCHVALQTLPMALPKLAIVTEGIELLDTLRQRQLFPEETLQLLRGHLEAALATLSAFPAQALHGDAHGGNLMNTTQGLLWTDWEDAFAGPVEWDVASIIWNAKLLDNDQATVDRILAGYREAGGSINEEALHHSLVARAAVMTAWYPILYPNPNAERRERLQRRLAWLREQG